MGKRLKHINYKGKYKIFFLIIAICLIAVQADTLDYPHTTVNNIGCGSCHYIWGSEPSLLKQGLSYGSNIDDTIYNSLCWSCHNDTIADYMKTHSSLQLDNSYGDWTVECRTCHNPHSQRQLKAYGSDSYLTSGTSTGITTTTLTDSSKSWSSDEYSGLVLIPNVSLPQYGYKIVSNTSDTITVDSSGAEKYINLSKVSVGDTYAVIYGKLIKSTIDTSDIIDPGESKPGEKTVKFFNNEGTNSFADGDSTYDGVCEVCHTMTTHFRNDGGGSQPLHENLSSSPAGTDCTTCHSHTDGFMHGGGSGVGCDECHGHDPGYPGVTGGGGTYQAHSTHTEDGSESDDFTSDQNKHEKKGPKLACSVCHNTSSFPDFADGVTYNNYKSGAEMTTVCNTCHSPNGTYDGVNDSVVGAKNNWRSYPDRTASLIYNNADGELLSGKEKWCATCHDEDPSQVSSIDAPNVIGDEDNSGGDGIYGAWGYYKSGHGLPASETYTYSGGITSGAGKGCLDCHDSETDHVDGDARTFDCSDGCDPSEYRISYRLQQVSGSEPMEIPWTGLGSSELTKFRLCVQAGCHDTNASDKFTTTSLAYTNLITEYDGTYYNRHTYHLNFANQNRYRADYDYSQSVNSRINCVICHNVHGSTQLAMVRDGKLINREPGFKIWYHDDPEGGSCCEGTVTWLDYNTDPPSPEDLPLSASTGTIWRGLTSANLCSHCHANNNTIPEYRGQDPYQSNLEQIPTLDWTGETNYESDGVHPDSGYAETNFAFRIEYTDTNNDSPSTIQIWLDEDDSGTYESGEKYDMTELDSGDTNYTNGKIYTKNLTISEAGDNTLNYRFYAVSNSQTATGDPTSDSTVSVMNNAPTLAWTNQTYYTSDGVHPDSGGNGADYEFRVKYTDLDNEAPTVIQLWIDEDDSGTYDVDEKYTMIVIGGQDGNYTNGEFYTKTLALTYTGDGIYNYRFYATEGEADATGDPTSNSTVTVSLSSNNAPLLEWHSLDCLTEGARPNVGGDNTTYEFWVKYTDSDDEAPSTIQVWIDMDDDASYEAGEKYDLTVEGGDGDYTNGEIYKKSLVVPYDGDGVFKYRYFANDGTDDATGTPVSDSILTVLNSTVVRPSGTSLNYDYTSIITAANAVSGYIVVYPNDDFSAATYSEYITLNNKDNRTLQSACGADYTIISGSGGSTVTIQDSSNFVLDGFSITGDTGSNGIYINRVDSTTASIKNSKIYGNSNGIYNNDADNVPVELDNVEIYNNSSRGIFLVNSDDDINIVNSEIHSHNVSNTGAALYSGNGATVTIDKSVIRDNTTTAEGGALYINLGTVTITNSIFADNQGSNGGVIRSNSGPTLTVVNSTFVDNTATGSGGVLYLCALGNHTFRNTIFWGNSASTDGDIAYKACSGFYSGFMTITDSSVSTSGTNFGNGTPTVSDNMTPAEDPLFVNAAADNYHITSSSPMIDQANATYAPADDVDGDSRPKGSADDIGADEYTSGTNNSPGLEWTGETNYSSDGVNPDSDVGGSNFEFRVKYTDSDNEAPTSMQVWVDEDDSSSYESDEKYDMTVDGGDSDYTNGENFTKTLTLDYAGDGSLNYRFYAFDGTDVASGTPTSDSTVTTTNNAPTLAWTGEANYAGDGVNPDSGANGSSFEFRVKYTDIDNNAPSSIQVWVDEDDLGSYDAGEKYDMTVDGGDSDYTNGELYTKTLSLSYTGNGVLNYRLYAADSEDTATGAPTSDSTVTITNSLPVGGYSADNVIPAAQITQSSDGDGVVTINWKGRDDQSNNVSLNTFEYSVNGGTDWNAPTNGDSSLALSTNWRDDGGSGYSTATIFGSAATHSFTFDTDHADVTGMDGVDQNDIKVRFTLNDGQDSASPATSESFQVDNEIPTATITSASYDSGADTLTITGTNFTTIADAATDIKTYVDWTKFVWDINNDGATTADYTFVVGEITSLTVTNATTLTLVMDSTKAATIEGNAAFGAVDGADTLDITAGFSKDAKGNAATTDGNATTSLSTGAALLTVTKTTDTNDGSCSLTDCSLREAISAANGNSGTDTVSIPAGTYTLTITGTGENSNATGDLDITDSVTIDGAGSGSTIINGGGIDRVFNHPFWAGITITIQDVKITNGNAGADAGGCLNVTNATLNITDSIVDSCGDNVNTTDGGAVYINGGPMTVSASTFSNNDTSTMGGAIMMYNETLTIDNSTFSNNTSGGGGGAVRVSNGTATITSSTLSGNAAGTSDQGGAINHSGTGTVSITDSTLSGNTAQHGGGVKADDVTLNRSTLTGNTATGVGGAIVAWGDTNIYIYNSTISGNNADGGAVLYTAGNCTVKSSTLANNTASWSGGLHINDAGDTCTVQNTIFNNNGGMTCGGSGSITSLGYNVDDNSSCGFTQTGDQQGTNAQINALSDNGGPTQTHSLQAGSPAIDAGDNTACAASPVSNVDQRGQARPVNGGSSLTCDVGSYEYVPSGVDVSGTVYTDEGTTTIADGAVVRLIVNGSSIGTDTTSSGAYTINTALSSGDKIIAYIDGHASDGTAVTVSDGNALSGLDVYADRLIVRHDNGGSLSIADMNTALGSYSDAEILYSVSDSDLTVGGAGTELYVWSGDTFAPSGAIDTVHMDITGTLNAAANAINVSGNWDVDATTGVFTSTGTVTFDAASGTNTITPGGTDTDHDFQNIVFNDAGGTATWQLQGDIDADGNITVTDGIFDTKSGSNYNVTVAGNFTDTVAGRVLGQWQSLFTIGGDFTMDFNNSTTERGDMGYANITLTGAGTLTINNLDSPWTYGIYKLTAGQSGNTTNIVSNSNFTVRNLLTVGSGTVTGSVELYFLYDATLSFDANSTLSVDALNFHSYDNAHSLPTLTNGYDTNIRLTGTDVIVNQTGDVLINAPHSLIIDGQANSGRSCTYNTNGYALTLNGGLTVGYSGNDTTHTFNATNSTVTVSGDMSLYDQDNAAFTATGSTVVLSGTNQNVNGSITFNNLTKTVTTADTLTFEAGKTTTVNGTVTLNGASGQLLTLASSTGSSAWNFNVNSGATKDIDYVSVSWSDASGSDASQKPINPSNSTDGNNNTDWFPTETTYTVCASGCDYSTIQPAINAATVGDIVRVSDGTYSENISFSGKDITVESVNGAASTTIQGSGSNVAVVTFSNGETSSAVLDGFTIDNQGANTDTRGIYITNGAPTIQNCIIDSNTANYRNGAGVYITGNSGATFVDTDITNNTGTNNEMGGGIHHSATGTLSITGGNISSNYAYKGGGGIYQSAGTLTVSGTTIASNTTSTGGTGGAGGIYYAGSGTLTVTNATIQSNTAPKYGGGGIWLNGASANISGTTFKSNTTSGDNGGGGILMNGTTPSLTLSKSKFLGNRVNGNNNNSDGGGLKIAVGTATITNSLFAGNVVDNAWNSDGGGIYNAGTMNLYFSTVADNYAYNNGGGIYDGGTENIYNSIVWGNAYGHGSGGVEIHGTPDTLYLTESSSDPSFTTRDAASSGTPTTGGDYSLQSSSNSIDTGDATNAPADDIEGTTRPEDISGKGDGTDDYDKGAYEYVAPLTATLHPSGVAQYDTAANIDDVGTFVVNSGTWADVFDTDDGDTTITNKCCDGGPNQAYTEWMAVNIDNLSDLTGGDDPGTNPTIVSLKFYVRARYNPNSGPEPRANVAHTFKVGYTTDDTTPPANTVPNVDAEHTTSGSGTDHQLFSSSTYTSGLDLAAIDNLLIWVRYDKTINYNLRVTEIYAVVEYIPGN